MPKMGIWRGEGEVLKVPKCCDSVHGYYSTVFSAELMIICRCKNKEEFRVCGLCKTRGPRVPYHLPICTSVNKVALLKSREIPERNRTLCFSLSVTPFICKNDLYPCFTRI